MKMIPTINMIKTGERIRQLRVDHGYRVRDLQKMIGLESPQSIYKWERGANLPSFDNAFSVAWIYGISVDELFVLDDDMSKAG